MAQQLATKHLYFVRHGQSQANVDRIYAGQVETPLTALGRQQAEAAAEAAKLLKIDHIISSPLSRALDTATIIAQALHIEPSMIELNDLLMERAYGSLVGKPWDFAVDIENVVGVEALEAVMDRGRQAYQYLQTLPFATILVVSHGTFYSALKAAIEPDVSLVEGREPANAEIIQLI